MTNRLLFLVFFFLSFQLSASSVEQQLINCSQITKASSRLSCFDAITSTIKVKSLNAKKASAEPAIAQPMAKQPTPAKSQDIFGFEAKIAASGPEKIVTTVKSLKKGRYGSYVITLENGQVWKQSDSISFRLAKGNVVYVKKGALGSFLLGKEGKKKRIRVKRIR